MKYLPFFAVIAFILWMLLGCATSPVGGYRCYMIAGPYLTYAESQLEAEKQVDKTDDGHINHYFDHAQWHYECVRGSLGDRLDGKN